MIGYNNQGIKLLSYYHKMHRYRAKNTHYAKRQKYDTTKNILCTKPEA